MSAHPRPPLADLPDARPSAILARLRAHDAAEARRARRRDRLRGLGAAALGAVLLWVFVIAMLLADGV